MTSHFKVERIVVLAMTDKVGALTGVVHFRGKDHTFYSCDRMGMDDIEKVLTKSDDFVSKECLHCDSKDVAGQCLTCGAPACAKCLKKSCS